VLTGEVTGAPADQPLATFPVVVDGDDVLVEL
jgi:nitrite reductase/ring-hydroxylating ferredoxin subunit